jgi:hypothetical protein
LETGLKRRLQRAREPHESWWLAGRILDALGTVSSRAAEMTWLTDGIAATEATLNTEQPSDRDTCALWLLQRLSEAREPIEAEPLAALCLALWERICAAHDASLSAESICVETLARSERRWLWSSYVEVAIELAGRVKVMRPAWAHVAVAEVVALALSLPEDSHSRTSMSLSSHLSDATELIQGAVTACCLSPSWPDDLRSMESTIQRQGDSNLRPVLLAQVASGWLDLNDLERASAVAQLIGAAGVVDSGFLRSLYAYIRRMTWRDEEERVLACLVLETVVQAALEHGNDAMSDSLANWFAYRSRAIEERQGAEAADAFLHRLVGFGLALARPESPTR